jgi:uridine kinase
VKLNILISGGPSTGKTTIAKELCALLDELKFSVAVHDSDIGREHEEMGHEEKLEALREKGLQIVIRTLQVPATGRFKQG